MKFKGIEVKGAFKVKEYINFFELWQNDDMIYLESTDGEDYWAKREFDENGMVNYFRDSDGYWWRREYDNQGKERYYENNMGVIRDHRPKQTKELSVKQISDLLGYDVKVVK